MWKTWVNCVPFQWSSAIATVIYKFKLKVKTSPFQNLKKKRNLQNSQVIDDGSLTTKRKFKWIIISSGNSNKVGVELMKEEQVRK